MTRQVQADIELHEARRRFGPMVALDTTTLRLPAGSFVSVMGGNGAGKSTLLRLLAGLSAPTSGAVHVAGVDRRRAGPGLRALIGYLGHESMLYADLTVRENLAFTARLYGLPPSVVEPAVARFDVAQALDRPVRVLSRGTRQRVALARALLHEPAVLLLDEPFTGLDLDSGDRLAAELAAQHQAGRTVVMTVHEASRAVLAQRLLVLAHGQVVIDRAADHIEHIEASLRAALRGDLPAPGDLAPHGDLPCVDDIEVAR